jgi:type IV secretion system protein VirB9
MNWQALLLTATLLAPLPALALTEPAPGPKDSRVRSTPYDPQQVVRLTSTGLSPLQVILEAGEKPVTIAGAMVFTDPKDAKDWLARPSGNVLILQPIRQMEPSVLFVRTVTADGQERHYAFELRTREGSVADLSDKAAYMTVQFAYKAQPTPEQLAAALAKREAARLATAERATKATLAMAQYNTPRNYQYDKRDPEGCPLLAPVYVFDDGSRTTLVFAPHAVLPEIYAINQDGKEAVATTINDTTATGLQVVLPTVQREMRLRRGGKVCALRNNAFDPVGSQPGGGSGTVSPDVVRQVRGR